MSTFLYVFRELLGAIRARSALSFLLTGLLLFLFLAAVGTFFLIVPSNAAREGGSAAAPLEALHVGLSPRLSSASIDGLYLEIREREDVKRIEFRFAQELDPEATGGLFAIEPAAAIAADDLAELTLYLGSLNGVTDIVEVRASAEANASPLPLAARIGLLLVIVLAAAGSFWSARRGYRELLQTFAGEIRTMRLSGTAERTLFSLLMAFGVLVGLLAGLMLLVVLTLLHYVAAAQATPSAWIEGLRSGGRVFGVSLGNLFLGLLLGALVGLLGTSLIHSREFDPLP